MTDAEVTAGGVARLAGVGRAAVSNWRRRFDDFPDPVGGTGTRPTFALDAVERWLDVHDKRRPVTGEEQVWQQIEALRGAASFDEILTTVGAFLIYLERSPGGSTSWQALSQEADGTIARRLPEAIRSAVSEEFAAAGVARIDKTWPTMLRAAAELAGEKTTAGAFELLVDKYIQSVGSQLSVTPMPLAELMVELAGGPKRTVLDPACGTGTLLLAAAHAGNKSVKPLGQEITSSLADLAAIRLLVHHHRPAIEAGDSLRSDAFADAEVDSAVVNPPFASRNWGRDELEMDPRWQYGVPARSEPELAWVQHALAHLRPGGGATILMPPSAGTRRSGRRVRAELLRRGALRAVIGLPSGAGASGAVPLQLWVLRRPIYDQAAPTEVLFVDSSAANGRRIDWGVVHSTALDAWRTFERGALSERPGVCRAVPVIDLLDDDVDLTPTRNLPRSAEVVAASDLTGTQERLRAAAAELPDLVPDVHQSDDAASWPILTVGELVRAGALAVHTNASHTESADDLDADPDAIPVLTSRDVVQDRQASGAHRAAGHDIELTRVEAGDVVTPAVGGSSVARVVTEGGAILGRGLYLLRPDPELLDPWFIAGFLRSAANARQMSSVGTVTRMDVRRAQLPRMPLDEQRRYGAIFRRIDELERRAREVAGIGDHLARRIAEGITTGTLSPSTET